MYRAFWGQGMLLWLWESLWSGEFERLCWGWYFREQRAFRGFFTPLSVLGARARAARWRIVPKFGVLSSMLICFNFKPCTVKLQRNAVSGWFALLDIGTIGCVVWPPKLCPRRVWRHSSLLGLLRSRINGITFDLLSALVHRCLFGQWVSTV